MRFHVRVDTRVDCAIFGTAGGPGMYRNQSSAVSLIVSVSFHAVDLAWPHVIASSGAAMSPRAWPHR